MVYIGPNRMSGPLRSNFCIFLSRRRNEVVWQHPPKPIKKRRALINDGISCKRICRHSQQKPIGLVPLQLGSTDCLVKDISAMDDFGNNIHSKLDQMLPCDDLLKGIFPYGWGSLVILAANSYVSEVRRKIPLVGITVNMNSNSSNSIPCLIHAAEEWWRNINPCFPCSASLTKLFSPLKDNSLLSVTYDTTTRSKIWEFITILFGSITTWLHHLFIDNSRTGHFLVFCASFQTINFNSSLNKKKAFPPINSSALTALFSICWLCDFTDPSREYLPLRLFTFRYRNI